MSRRAYALVQGLVNRGNQLRGVSSDSAALEGFYSRIYVELIDGWLARLEESRLDVLDAGCGTGEMALHFAAAGHRVTGIEIHKPSVEAARRRAVEAGTSVELIQGDLLERLRAFAPARFDAVLCMEVLYACVDFREIVEQFVRVLKPDGLLFATFRSPFYFITTLLRQGKVEEALHVAQRSEGVLRIATIPCYYNWQTEDEISSLYVESGLHVLEQRAVGVFSGTGYDGMAAIMDVDGLSAGAARAALRELETQHGVRDAGRYTFAVGRKRRQ